MEIGPNGCGLIIDRTAPHVHGGIRINQRHDGIGGGVTAGIPTLWVAHLVQRGDFVEGFAIQIHIAGVAYLDLWVRVYGQSPNTVSTYGLYPLKNAFGITAFHTPSPSGCHVSIRSEPVITGRGSPAAAR